MIHQEKLQKGWLPFTEAMATSLGIHFSAQRMIGVGIMHTALMLCQDEIHKPDGPNGEPQTPRKAKAVVEAMLSMMAKNPLALHQDTETLR